MPWEGFRGLYREQQEAVESYYIHLWSFTGMFTGFKGRWPYIQTNGSL